MIVFIYSSDAVSHVRGNEGWSAKGHIPTVFPLLLMKLINQSTGDKKSSRLPWQKSYCWWGLLWWSFEKRLDCCDWNKNSAFPLFTRSPPWLSIFPSRTWRTMPLLTKRLVLEIFTIQSMVIEDCICYWFHLKQMQIYKYVWTQCVRSLRVNA